jgi:hypothetical protein
MATAGKLPVIALEEHYYDAELVTVDRLVTDVTTASSLLDMHTSEVGTDAC